MINTKTTSTKLLNSNGTFCRGNLDQSCFAENFSNIDKFLNEIEVKCGFFPEIKKTHFWNKLTWFVSIVLVVIILILMILYGSWINSLDLTWANYASAGIGVILICINFANLLNIKKKYLRIKEPYSKIIDAVIEANKCILDCYPTKVTYKIRPTIKGLIVEITFELINAVNV